MIDKNEGNRLFVLDTNVLMHDPMAIFRFDEHDIYLPMVVLEELDAHKTGLSEVARNVRQTNRLLVEMTSLASKEAMMSGIPIKRNQTADVPAGKIYFQTDDFKLAIPESLPGSKADNTILGTVLSVQEKYSDRNVTLVSKDINMRIKAGILGINAEDYFNDRVLDDVSLLHSGNHVIDSDFWQAHTGKMESWQEEGKTFYRLSGDGHSEWLPNDCISTDNDDFHALVKEVNEEGAVIQVADDFSQKKHSIWGIHARNREQNFAMNLLLDPDIDFVSLVGTAGSGKTLLTVAAGLQQVLDEKRYSEILMTRVTVPVGEDIGFLPGTEEEKMTPWMGALMDNLEVLQGGDSNDLSWEQDATTELLKKRIKIRSLNFMRGRTFLNRFIIIDEAQNLTSKQVKTLITRAGPGSKIVCLGDIKQIDTPYLTETTSGLTYAVDRFKSWRHGGHITLVHGERSRLADFAADNL